jgi:hypothetical protein
MDTKLTIVGDSEFEMLARLGDYDRRNPNALSRIESDTFFIVFRQSEWDKYQRSVAQVEAECAGLAVTPFQN